MIAHCVCAVWYMQHIECCTKTIVIFTVYIVYTSLLLQVCSLLINYV